MRPALILVLVCGCRQLLGFEPISPPSDGDTELPDAGPCQDLTASCIGDTLRSCMQLDELPTDTACSWGCLDAPRPHCGVLSPSGGAVTALDFDTTGLEDIVLSGSLQGSINTDTGEITGIRAAGSGVIAGIDFTARDKVGVFRLSSLVLTAPWIATGQNALAIVALDEIVIDELLDLRGSCTDNASGPGGHLGGASAADGSGPGAGGRGLGGLNESGGGGGGGFGGTGGLGGAKTNGDRGPAGIVSGDAAITTLFGGSGGGGGGPATFGGPGGGGGGAVQLVSNARVRVLSVGINAGGCGGKGGQNDGSGGGGGAGGTILIEAPIVVLDGVLAVNGGGGGGGADGTAGGLGTLTRNRATAGQAGGANGGDGGGGGATVGVDGVAGQNDNQGGGGGGAVGRIRINTRFGMIQLGDAGFTSPSLLSLPAAQGVAPVE